MNIANHFPSKKRRDSEIDVTPTRITPGGKHKINQDIRHKKKRSRVYSPSCNSSDESMIEISWDNNSPSPRRAFSGRRKKISDITSIINKISKKKNSDLIIKDNDESLLTTWKLGNLPSSNSFRLSTKPRRLSARRSIQSKVTTKFSDELKRFLEGVNLAGCNAIEDPCIRRSPRLIAMKTKIASSPVTSERFDQGVYYSSKNATPRRKHKLPLLDSICTTPIGQKSEKSFVSTEKQKLQLSLLKNSLDFKRSKKETSDFIDIDLNDGLDAIISSHIEQYDHTTSLNKSAENLVNRKTNQSNDSNNESETCKESTDGFFTKIKPDIYEKHKKNIEKKIEIVTTPKRQMLVDFNDADGFDELLIDLDDEIRCKSQEVTRLTPSQRVLRTRSMTSPFPFNKSFNRQSKLAEKERLTENHNKSIDLDTLSLHSPIKITPVTKVLQDKSFSSNVNTHLPKCPNLQKNSSSQIKNKVYHKPSVLKGRNTLTNETLCCNIPSIKDMPLNLSSIEKSGKENYLEDEPLTLDMPVRNRPTPFMSTQRCSYSEIERKRQEAQNRLKEKLKKRKK